MIPIYSIRIVGNPNTHKWNLALFYMGSKAWPFGPEANLRETRKRLGKFRQILKKQQGMVEMAEHFATWLTVADFTSSPININGVQRGPRTPQRQRLSRVKRKQRD